jgi:uncharacterized membrane protein (UPF0127 family)
MTKIMKKFYFFIIVIFLLSGCMRKENNLEKNKIVKINGHEIMVEIANTPKLQYQGLSGRKNLCADCGMFFVFKERSEKTFVMRDMNFPLDIIFIDGVQIVKIYKNLKPEGESLKNFYPSGQPVDYVLEVSGGYADAYGIKEGNIIKFNLGQ